MLTESPIISQMMKWLDGITDSVDLSLSNSGTAKGREAWCAAVHGVAKSRTQLSDRTTACPHKDVAGLCVLFYSSREFFKIQKCIGPVFLSYESKSAMFFCQFGHNVIMN